MTLWVSGAAGAWDVLSWTGVAGITDFLKISLLLWPPNCKRSQGSKSSIPFFHRGILSSPNNKPELCGKRGSGLLVYYLLDKYFSMCWSWWDSWLWGS